MDEKPKYEFVRVTWPEAAEALWLSRPTVQSMAWANLRRSNPDMSEDALEKEMGVKGVTFLCGDQVVWICRRGRNYVVCLKPTVDSERRERGQGEEAEAEVEEEGHVQRKGGEEGVAEDRAGEAPGNA